MASSKPLDDAFLRRVDETTDAILDDPHVTNILFAAVAEELIPLARSKGIEPFTAEGMTWVGAINTALTAALLVGIHAYAARRRGVPLVALTAALDAAGLMGETQKPIWADTDYGLIDEIQAEVEELDHSACGDTCQHYDWAHAEYHRRREGREPQPSSSRARDLEPRGSDD